MLPNIVSFNESTYVLKEFMIKQLSSRRHRGFTDLDTLSLSFLSANLKRRQPNHNFQQGIRALSEKRRKIQRNRIAHEALRPHACQAGVLSVADSNRLPDGPKRRFIGIEARETCGLAPFKGENLETRHQMKPARQVLFRYRGDYDEHSICCRMKRVPRAPFLYLLSGWRSE